MQPKRFAILQVITTHYHRHDALSNMVEIEQLIDTFGGVVVHKDIQHKVHPHRSTYVGPGKVELLQTLVKSLQIDCVVINDIIKSSQIFRLEKSLWDVNHLIQVWDRVDLILNIFERHAASTEAKVQIELARIEHQGPRLYGLGKDRLSRQGGGIGTRGLGETNIERERRLIKNRQAQLKRQLKKLASQKHLQMRQRRAEGLGPVALIGYTSAGKTSLFNRLTGKRKATNKNLFTTLDTVVGKMKTSDESLPVVVSDTIGFIRDLPPQLINAFKSTLFESLEAELILHIIDASDDQMLEKIEVVNQILADLAIEQPQLLVFNKLDRLILSRRRQIKRNFATKSYIYVSAHTGDGLDILKQLIASKVGKG